MPVVAVPGADGCDDRVGAVGLDAPRRHGQPRIDDVVQSLRPGRGGRLAPPGRRGTRPGRAGLPPHPVRAEAGGGLTSASARHITPYGETSIEWRLDDAGLHVTVVVPVGAEGILDLEGEDVEVLGHGTHERTVSMTVLEEIA
ncbi:alpha-L-rhamnosidase C-terminal domain-containing protein [Microbacterium sp. 4R-513]|uniref:alpha-L-rhamnosidase C-terminal domain-containing protein n=1 Tax=Microbacterium sp. 4R-513 TaxID=2567934 RepID=UPI003219D360